MKYTPITENHLFRKAYSKGKRFCGRYVAVYILNDYAAKRIKNARPDKKYVNRIGISTSKKIGGAVVRSRVRRIIREGYYGVCRKAELKSGHLIVITARSAAASVKSCDIENELMYAFSSMDFVVGKKEI